MKGEEGEERRVFKDEKRRKWLLQIVLFNKSRLLRCQVFFPRPTDTNREAMEDGWNKRKSGEGVEDEFLSE